MNTEGLATVILTALVVVQQLTKSVEGFHLSFEEIFNEQHCWPLDANDINDETIDCGDLVMEWVTRPLVLTVEEGETLEMAVNISASSKAELGRLGELCERECPSDCNVTAEDCCVWHADVHICYPNTSETEPPSCVPWNQENLILTEKTCGPFGVYNVTLMLYNPGVTAIVYHLQVGNISIALGEFIRVSHAVCGDGHCQQPIERCNSCEGANSRGRCEMCQKDCCPATLTVDEIVGTVFAMVVPMLIGIGITLFIVTVIYYKRKKKMKDESWVISYNDIITDAGKKAMSSMSSLTNKKGIPNSVTYPSSLNLQAQQIFTEVGSYKGIRVAIRRVRVKKSLLGGCGHVIADLRREVLKIRYLEHQNLCKFIGATIKDPHPNTVIISEYCAKGSLNDVLLNDAVPLTWNFRFSFAADIARGMAYLHSHGITHGRLTSSNCVIDDRWVTKVTDFGLDLLKYFKGDDEEEEGGDKLQGDIPKVYRAPEVRNLQPQTSSDSEPADVYSYAIILYEIATGMDPRSEDAWSLDANWKPKINLTDLTKTECPCPQGYLNLINKCWTYSPQTRPPFVRIRKELRDANPSHTSAIDNMMLMMEKYSKHLEELVQERTAQLEDEKRKTTNLLYRMIPETVANDLKNGYEVKPNIFESVTIFFSDIVGFTNLASTSTPTEIVDLLNKLYTEFDQVLDQFDVYKVETIGDAYMVVSGVPVANGDRHAGEIAKMALKLMAVCETFVIPHQPETKFQIRAGIHSGSVCAGIVGKKMPRYCLFGDTVNTASRMESNSIAMHIQCSDSTYQLLETLGGFILEDRGEIPIKGKGTMNTWWLKGYKEPEIEFLPPPPPLSPLLPSSNDDEPHSPIIKEPIRDAPKKLSTVDKTPSELKSSTKSLSRKPSSTALDIYKRHQSLTSCSINNLRSIDDGEKKGNERAVKTMPRELCTSESATELAQRFDPVSSRKPKFSVPTIPVTSYSLSSKHRRVTQASIETVGLMGGPNIANGDIPPSGRVVVVAPLENINDTHL